MNRIIKKVFQLEVGDKLMTGEVILSKSRGLRTPSGKYDLVVKSGDKNYVRQWNKNTEIAVQAPQQ